MPSTGIDHFVRADKGGLSRDPNSIVSHRMTGASDEQLLQSAVSMQVIAERENDHLFVTVTITNDQTGHHVPTDSPLRHLILLVQPASSDGNPLTQLSGPTLPDWAGIGDPHEGYFAGQPGTAYAKILKELWTNVSPTGAYWNQTVIVSDNRIPAMGSDETRYTFAAPANEPVNIDTRLLFRRAFITLADQKSWNLTDILMEQSSLHLP